jgi:hypothetical protein
LYLHFKFWQFFFFFSFWCLNSIMCYHEMLFN